MQSPDSVVYIELTKNQWKMVRRESKRTGMTPSEVVEQIVEWYLRQLFYAALARMFREYAGKK